MCIYYDYICTVCLFIYIYIYIERSVLWSTKSIPFDGIPMVSSGVTFTSWYSSHLGGFWRVWTTTGLDESQCSWGPPPQVSSREFVAKSCCQDLRTSAFIFVGESDLKWVFKWFRKLFFWTLMILFMDETPVNSPLEVYIISASHYLRRGFLHPNRWCLALGFLKH